MRHGKFFMTTTALVLTSLMAPVYAQAQSTNIDEIIVTARKRAESIQDVPIAMSVFTAEDIKDAGIDNVEDIANLTPGFTFAKLLGSETSTPVVRGMSTTIGEPNVGFFVDGVYQSSRNIMDAMLGDNIERVEIAKGPQSALYGRNTFAGAINFITKKPSKETTGQIAASVGNGGHYALRGNVSGPISENLFYQVGGTYSQTDGFFENGLTGDDLDGLESTILTGAIMYYPSENSEIIARIGYDTTRNGDLPLRFLTNNAASANPTPAPIPNALQLYRGEIPNYEDGFGVTPGFKNHDNLTLSLSTKFDLGSVELTSITGYSDLELNIATDNDYEARSIRYLTQDITQKEFSQEVRLTSLGDGPLRWVAGAYYYNLSRDGLNVDSFVDGALALSTALQATPLAGLLPPGTQNLTEASTKSFALFGSLEYDVSDRLSATFEGRWTTENKEVRAVDTNVLTLASGTFNQDASFDNFVPRFTLDYQVTNDALLYASVAKAVKTGGFNVVTTSGAIADHERTYDPEKSWNYELGLKSTLADGRATLNIAGFYTDWSDQIVRALGSTFAVLNANAGKSSVKGVEAELRANILDGLDLTAGLAYTDSSYDEYTFGALAGLGLDPVLDGVRLQYVSKWQANASVQYERPISARLDWKSRLDVSHQSDQSVVQSNDAYIGDATLVNLRTGIASDNWEITAWVKNVFEEDSAVGGLFTTNQASRFDTANSLANPNISPLGLQAFGALGWSRNPREYGLTARYKF